MLQEWDHIFHPSAGAMATGTIIRSDSAALYKAVEQSKNKYWLTVCDASLTRFYGILSANQTISTQ